MSRIGVFICHCGENIARTVDVERVTEAAKEMRGVVFATNYKYMCSDPGQNLVKQSIKEHKLDGVVVSACSPRMHEVTFRRATAEAGLNPFLCEMANIREHCSWVHEDRDKASEKAIDLVHIMVEKVRNNQPLQPIKVPITKRALIIGGGIAGIQAALDVANGGHEVILVEREASIGGHMAQLSETFPTLDCSQCIMTPRMVEVAQHPNIKLYTWSEVEDVDGFIGNFKVKIRKKVRGVNLELCTGCGACQQVCPIAKGGKVKSEFDAGMGSRGAIYVPFPQAVPNKPVIDQETCLRFKAARKKQEPIANPTEDKKGVCGLCYQACPITPEKAIDFTQEEEIIEEEVGGIIVATGYQVLGNDMYGEYGGGKYEDIINGLQFERLASASGPTGGEIRRPSDGKVPESVVFIQCVGSRDNSKGISYCSKICCMYTAKHTMLYKHKVHHGQAYVFYMDVRSGGKNYEEFVRRAIEEDGAVYLRGRVSRIYKKNGKLVVKGIDTLSSTLVEIDAEMVVLASAIQAQPDIEALAQKLGVPYDAYGFLSEAHPKLRPVETASAGVFLAGCCQAPKDIPEAVAQASGAASKVLGLFSSDEMEREPVVARVHRTGPPVFTTCIACWACYTACPVGAIEKSDDIKDRSGNVIKMAAKVNESKCIGCGVCAAVCRSNSIDLQGFTDEQVYAEINAI